MNLSKIVLLIDKSGSMASIRKDAEGGVNNFIKEQQTVPGECSISIIEFSGTKNTKYSGPILDCPEYSMYPSGSTSLLDALGNSIGDIQLEVDKAKRAGADNVGVMFVVVTDGEDNTSREFKLDAVKNLIKEKESENWQFTYLGTNQDGFSVGGSMGFNSAASYNDSANAYAATSQKFTRMRSAVNDGMELHGELNQYSDEEKRFLAE